MCIFRPKLLRTQSTLPIPPTTYLTASRFPHVLGNHEETVGFVLSFALLLLLGPYWRGRGACCLDVDDRMSFIDGVIVHVR